jgi:hypothetical protein
LEFFEVPSHCSKVFYKEVREHFSNGEISLAQFVMAGKEDKGRLPEAVDV